jgi:hypothetical protein
MILREAERSPGYLVVAIGMDDNGGAFTGRGRKSLWWKGQVKRKRPWEAQRRERRICWKRAPSALYTTISFWTSAKSTASGSRAQHFDDVLNFAELGNIDVSVETVVDSMIIRPTLRHGFAPTTTHWEQKHGHGAHDKKVSSGGKKC